MQNLAGSAGCDVDHSRGITVIMLAKHWDSSPCFVGRSGEIQGLPGGMAGHKIPRERLSDFVETVSLSEFFLGIQGVLELADC
jgi:hypothetical protein